MNPLKIIENIGLGAKIITDDIYGCQVNVMPRPIDRNVVNYNNMIFQLLLGFIQVNDVKQCKSGIYARMACNEQIRKYINTNCPDKYFRYPLMNSLQVNTNFLQYYLNTGSIDKAYTLACNENLYNPDTLYFLDLFRKCALITEKMVVEGTEIKDDLSFSTKTTEPCFKTY